MKPNTAKTGMSSQITLKKRIESQNKKEKQVEKKSNLLSKPKKEWNFHITDLEKYKLSEKEMVC